MKTKNMKPMKFFFFFLKLTFVQKKVALEQGFSALALLAFGAGHSLLWMLSSTLSQQPPPSGCPRSTQSMAITRVQTLPTAPRGCLAPG